MAPRADMRRRVVIVSGTDPPDIGGPATHASDLRRELLERGHRVCVVTLGDGRRVERDRSRSDPTPLALAPSARDRRRLARRPGDLYDVVYATGMLPSAVAGARTAGKPVVVKVVGDPVWERGRRLGLTDDEFEPFQQERGGPLRMRAMRALRNRTLRSASVVTAPSEFLAATVDRWLAGPSGVEVIPNGVRAPVTSDPERTSEVRAIYVGRLVPHKRVDELIRAVATDDRLRLDVVGSGPDLDRLRGVADATAVADRVRFLGPLAHDDVLSSIARPMRSSLPATTKDCPTWSSKRSRAGRRWSRCRWEAWRRSSRTVAAGSSSRSRRRSVPLARGSPTTNRCVARCAREPRRAGERWSSAATADGVEAALDRAAGTPRIVLLGKTHASDPPTPGDLRKRAVVVKACDPVFVNVGTPGIRRVAAPRRWSCRIFPALRGSRSTPSHRASPSLRPRVAVGPRSSARVHSKPPGCSESCDCCHGVAARRRGGVARRSCERRDPLRRQHPRVFAKPASAGGRARLARRGRSARGESIDRLVRASRRPAAGPAPFPAWTDIGRLLAMPPVDAPTEPHAIFVGALEASKGIDVLIDAWPLVVRKIPEARLTLVGGGSARSAGARSHPSERRGRVGAHARGPAPRAHRGGSIDEARVLIVPSRPKALGGSSWRPRARGRPVVASEVGGIPELVSEGERVSLVPPEDPQALSVAIVEVLDDRSASEAMGRRARARVERDDPDRSFAAGFAELAAWVASR